jgi:Dynamin GTPase effector domain
MEAQVNLIREHLALYMRIFTKKYLDAVPKNINYHVVDRIVGFVKNELFYNLGKENLVSRTMEKPIDVFQQFAGNTFQLSKVSTHHNHSK